jgi:hypothetical protein
MIRKYSSIQIRLYLFGLVILLAGLICATWIYFADTDEISDSSIIGYEIVAGHAYPITATDSKRYQNEEERMGGKFAAVADEITQWFSSLFHGKRLACLIAILSIGIAVLLYWVAQHPDYKIQKNGSSDV